MRYVFLVACVAFSLIGALLQDSGDLPTVANTLGLLGGLSGICSFFFFVGHLMDGDD